MIHRILVGSIIYFGGAAITAGLMILGSRRSGERPGGLYDRAFMSLWVALWPIGLPVVLSVLVGLWEPREVDLDEESVDL
jgi:hypothetical protein